MKKFTLCFSLIGIIMGLMTTCINLSFAQTINENFWVANGNVEVAKQYGDKLFLGGQFTWIGPNKGHGVVFDVGGSGGLESGWPRVDGLINVVTPDESGGWYIGGAFTHVGGVARNYFAHIKSDKSLDSWDPNPDSYVYDIVIDDENPAHKMLWIAGSFSTIGGGTRSRIARFDITTSTPILETWSPPTINATVRTIVPYEGKLYIGGSFSTVGSESRRCVAALSRENGTVFTTWKADVTRSFEVNKLILYDNNIYIFGSFEKITDNVTTYTKNGTAMIDTNGIISPTWGLGLTSWGSHIYDAVIIEENYVPMVYITGNFIISTRKVVAKYCLNPFSLLWTLAPTTSANGFALSVFKNPGTGEYRVYFGGEAMTIAGQTINYLARFSPGDGSLVTSWHPKPNTNVTELAYYNGKLYVAGNFIMIDGKNRPRFAVMDVNTGEVIDDGWIHTMTEDFGSGEYYLHGIAFSDDQVYIAGCFDKVDGQTRLNAASFLLSNGTLTAWAPNLNGNIPPVRALAIKGDNVFIGGEFATVNGVTANKLCAVDKSSGILTWNPNSNGNVHALYTTPSRLYVGGGFTQIGGINRNKLAAYDITGSVPVIIDGWQPSVSSGIPWCFGVLDNRVYVGGAILVNGQSGNYLAALDAATGNNISGWAPSVNGVFYDIEIAGATMYISGAFSTVGGQPRHNFAELDAYTGAVLPWAPNPYIPGSPDLSYLTSVESWDNNVYIGGYVYHVLYNGGWHYYRNQFVATDPNMKFAITVLKEGDGTISPAGDANNHVYLQYLGSQLFSFTPNPSNPCCHIIKVEIDGVNHGALSSYQFNNVTANHTLKVYFSEALSGIKTVGISGADYSSLKVAFDAINENGLCGDLDLQITSDLTETSEAVINQWTEVGIGGYNLKIYPTESDRLISGSIVTSLVTLDGADRVTIGSSGTGKAIYNLTLRNTSTDCNTIMLKNDACNNTIQHCHVEGGGSGRAIYIANGVTTGNDHNTITNCVVRDRSDDIGVPSILIDSYGLSAVAANSDNVISDCELYNFTGLGILSALGNEDWTITNNTIYQTCQLSTNITGIGLYSQGENNVISQNTIRDMFTTEEARGIVVYEVEKVDVNKNRIFGFPSSNGSTSDLKGIWIYGPTGGDVSLVNNQISIIPTYTNSQDIYGILDAGSSGDELYVDYNSLYIGGSGAGTNKTYALKKTGNQSYTYLRNNLFFNGRTGGTGGHFAVGTAATPGTNHNSDYGFYAANGPTSIDNFEVGTTACDFDTWKTTVGGDNGSWSNSAGAISATNLFEDIAIGNLNIKPGDPECWCVNGKGAAISGIADDYGELAVRSIVSGIATDIGSDEFEAACLPPIAVESGPPDINTTTSYYLNGKRLGAITWGESGTVPSSISLKLHSGKNPPEATGNHSNFYWEINATGGAGYTYEIAMNYDPAMKGNIGTESDIRLAKRDGGGWTHYSGTVTDVVNKKVILGGLTSFSEFALSEEGMPLPIELASFIAVQDQNSGGVRLEWITLSEVNNCGFYVERKTDIDQSFIEISNSFLPGNGTTTEMHDYSFVDNTITLSGIYHYRLRQVDNDGLVHYSQTISINVSALAVRETAPIEFRIHQNYPNPTNPKTTIKFSVDKVEHVIVVIYNTLGQEVANLFDETAQPGDYYNVEFDGANLSSGIYYYKVKTVSRQEIRKMILLK